MYFNGTSTGASRLILNAGSLLDLRNAFLNSMTVGSIEGAGSISLGTSDLIVGGNNLSTTFSGVIDWTYAWATLTKVGSGTLTLSANNTSGWQTTVNAGTLNLTGSLVGYVTIYSGGTLTGTGQLWYLYNSGKVVPGASGAGGTLSTQTYAGPGILDIQFNGSAYGRLIVTNTVQLSGGTLSITGPNFVPGKYDILSGSLIQGTFSAVESPTSSGFNFYTRYTPTDIYEIITSASGFVTSMVNSNQIQVAHAMDGVVANEMSSNSSNLDNVIVALSGLTPSQAQNAFNQISGDSLASFQSTNLRGAAAFMNQMTDRANLAGRQNLSELQKPLQFAYNGDLNNFPGGNTPGDMTHRLWTRGIGMFDHTNGDSAIGSPGSTSQTGGFQVGYDHPVGERGLLGVSAGYANTSLSVSDRSSSGNTTNIQGGIYGRYAPVPWFFNGSVGYVDGSNSMSRTISFPGIDEEADSSFKSGIYTALAEAGYSFKPRPTLSLEPTVSIQDSYLKQNGFTESGAPGLDLAVGDRTLNSVVSALGVRLRRSLFPNSSHPATLGAHAAWQHELGSTDNTISAQFADAPGPTFSVQGTPRSRESGVLGLDARMDLSKKVQLFADASCNLSSNQNSQIVSAGLSWFLPPELFQRSPKSEVIANQQEAGSSLALEGHHYLFGTLGVSSPLSKITGPAGNDTIGKSGPGFGGQYLYQPASFRHWMYGGEVFYHDFGDNTSTNLFPTYYVPAGVRISYQQLDAHLLLRRNFDNTGSPITPYYFFGPGIFQGHLKLTGTVGDPYYGFSYPITLVDAESLGFSGVLGFGFEGVVADHWVLGAEARLTMTAAGKYGATSDGESWGLSGFSGGTSAISYVLRAGYKF
jgi:autotransporter-associated beta strand protein